MGTLRDLQFALQLKIEELRQRDTLIDELELELDTKDELIRRLQEELDRYRATVSLPGPSAVSAASPSPDENKPRAKRKTVISESVTPDPDTFATMLHRSCVKSQKSQRLILAAFGKNGLLKNLDDGEMRAIIACMYPTSFQPGSFVFEEGTKGAQAYVLEEGRLDVTRDGVKLYTVEAEDVFGELSLLYNCTHTYSVAALTDSQLWVIERRSYQTILTQRAMDGLHRSSELLSRVSCLQSLPEDIMMNMSDVMQEAHYSDGDYIIRQEASGDTFYIISKGQVKVTEMKPGHEEQLVLSTLSETQWFGEKALWGNEVQTVNVIAAGDVTCLLIDRETFRDISGGLVVDSRPEVRQNVTTKHESDEDPAFLLPATLRDLQIVCTLGVGEFGHVDLVQTRSDHKCLFAMRVVKKKLVFSSGQQELLLRERNILQESRCPFIVRLHKTFRDAECIYMLTEACLCGDLHSLLVERGCLDECDSRFYTACVTEAVVFLHSQSVICRDIKPETVALDHRGYAKLTGSRCWKKVDRGKKTYTFCGTPGFMAPEVILNKGHGRAADFWSLGGFVFELLSGRLPVCGADTLMTLTLTLCGTDQIDFPKTIGHSAASLIQELCRHNPSERLGSRRNGAKDIQRHKWFEGFNWDGLCAGSLSPPLIPKVKHPLDTRTPAHYSWDPTEPSATWADF